MAGIDSFAPCGEGWRETTGVVIFDTFGDGGVGTEGSVDAVFDVGVNW